MIFYQISPKSWPFGYKMRKCGLKLHLVIVFSKLQEIGEEFQVFVQNTITCIWIYLIKLFYTKSLNSQPFSFKMQKYINDRH